MEFFLAGGREGGGWGPRILSPPPLHTQQTQSLESDWIVQDTDWDFTQPRTRKSGDPCFFFCFFFPVSLSDCARGCARDV